MNSGINPELEKIFGLHLREHLAELLVALARNLRPEAHAPRVDSSLDDLIEPDECSAADEQDVGRVDLQKVLLRVLAATLGRHVRDRAFDDLQQCLLDTFAAHVTRDARVVAFARDLVDLVDVDNPGRCGLLDVVVGVLQQAAR